MDDRWKNARNIAILLLIAAVVAFVPGGGRAASTFSTVLGVVFAAGFAYAGVWFYRQRRVDLRGRSGRRSRGLAGLILLRG